MITDDTPATFGVHTPLIMKEETKMNQLRWCKRFFDRQKPSHALPNMRGNFSALTTFQLKNYYFKEKLNYYSQSNLQLTTKHRLTDLNTL